MRKDTAIVFVHKGAAWYSPYVLNQARSASPDSKIVLIGDDPACKNIAVAPIENLENQDLHRFRALYSHRSTMRESSELFCWEGRIFRQSTAFAEIS